MCELLGISLKSSARLNEMQNDFVKEFLKRGKSGKIQEKRSLSNPHNPDGWGIALYPGKDSFVIKEPLMSSKSTLAKNLNIPFSSRTWICHIREMSKNGSQPAYENTHPFEREINGRSITFAHNGTITKYDDLVLESEFKPIGGTDSEYVFCHIAHEIKKRNIKNWKKYDFEWLNGLLKKINERGAFNCMISDGQKLFCYRDMNAQRELVYAKIKKGYVITRFPFVKLDWQEFKGGELIVFENGEMIFKSSQ